MRMLLIAGFAVLLSACLTTTPPSWAPGNVIVTSWLCRTLDDVRHVVSHGGTQDEMRVAILGLQSEGRCVTRSIAAPVMLAKFVEHFTAFAGPGEIWETSTGWFAVAKPKGAARGAKKPPLGEPV